MTDREIESGFELVVDNRKLIIAFAIVILVCGCFFVWGFMAGKRQGMQLSAIADTDVSSGSGIEGSLPPTADTNESVTETPSLEEDAVQQDLDWYHSVNKKGSEPAGVQPPRASSSTKKTADTSQAGSSVVSGPVTYSVQVGAFKQRPEAEAHARNVRSKGFDSRIEPPESSGKLYLVKVGKFDTRAEAVAVQLRLKKNGFSCFVKTN
ncbi:MAG: SPOR domain-containing protein [Acidobacteria bacterium]|nr:SPOR domain-containing protein [Acidobacteriota bacterium]